MSYSNITAALLQKQKIKNVWDANAYGHMIRIYSKMTTDRPIFLLIKQSNRIDNNKNQIIVLTAFSDECMNTT